MLIRIKSLFAKLFKFINRQGVWWIAYMSCTYIIPLVLINEKYILTQHHTTVFRITVAGYLTALVFFLTFRKWLYGRMLTLKAGFLKWGCHTLHRGIPIALIFLLFAFIVKEALNIKQLLIHITVSLVFGAVFQLAYFLNKKNKEMEHGEQP